MIPVSLDGLFKMLRRVVPSSTKVQMSSWANFYRKLAHEARLRAVQATTVRTGKIRRGCNGVVNACRMGRAKGEIALAPDPYSNSFSWASSSRYSLSERNRGLG